MIAEAVMGKNRQIIVGISVLFVSVLVGQIVTYLVAPDSWRSFIERLPVIIAMITFWGPILGVISTIFVYFILRLLGFDNLDEIRIESVEQNNPTPAILFVGTLIASLLFLLLVIRP
jgi:hypothetical protein